MAHHESRSVESVLCTMSDCTDWRISRWLMDWSRRNSAWQIHVDDARVSLSDWWEPLLIHLGKELSRPHAAASPRKKLCPWFKGGVVGLATDGSLGCWTFFCLLSPPVCASKKGLLEAAFELLIFLNRHSLRWLLPRFCSFLGCSHWWKNELCQSAPKLRLSYLSITDAFHHWMQHSPCPALEQHSVEWWICARAWFRRVSTAYC